jgi:hypothetical protein
VAPLVAEFLLGDFPMKWLPLLIVLAPMYGGGAVLIREVTRRTGRGWTTMLLLAAAYGLVEEGFITQSLFNPNYLKMHLLSYAYLPALGIGGWWTLLMFNVHTFWSIGVPIALVEALHPKEKQMPWLGRAGLWVTGAVFVLGLAVNAAIGRRQDHFVASHVQLLFAGVVCAALIAAAFLLPDGGQPKSGAAPSPWVTGACAFVLGMFVMATSPRLGWGACAILLAADALFLTFVTVLSRRSGWTQVHIMSVAGGGALTYGVHGFLQMPVVPSSVLMARIGNAVFFSAAAVVVAIAARRSSRERALTVSAAAGRLNE